MMNRFERFEMLVGKETVQILKSKKVIVFGVGGVGGYVCEALARSGVGRVDVVDNDTVSITNINRQIIALETTVGKSKTSVMAERMKSINPEICTREYNMFYLPETAEEIDLSQYDFVVDAIDTVSGKLELAIRCQRLGVPLVSSMGTGNKLDPTKIVVTDIYKTKVCPLARVMRTLCKKNGIKKLTVVYSEEEPKTPLFQPKDNENPNKSIPASSAFVPPAAGLTIASYVLQKFMK
ncbi:MAG: tRNA threonylcarbamoyladenosine dehydratase [Clostridia bacterium]|nr:tRNA threonylcarbamoyladenosine dehydratase [Clostridia bacterium]